VSNLLNHTNQYTLNIKLNTKDDIFKLYFPYITKLINLAQWFSLISQEGHGVDPPQDQNL